MSDRTHMASLGELPFFSVVIPTFNRSGRVVKAIDSVLQQKSGDFEVIVVDDGSTDGTASEVESACGNDPRIRLVRQPHRERGAARNRGIDEARGEYLVFLDSDDLMKPTHLGVLRELIDSNPGIDFVATRFGIAGRDDPAPQWKGIAPGWHGRELFLRGNPLGCNVCVRRKSDGLIRFRETPAYESEDWVFLVSNLAHSRILIDRRSTVLMTDHDGRTMRGDPRDLIRAKEAAVSWILDNVALDERERTEMRAHADSFCALHAHLAGDRRRAVRYLRRSTRVTGVRASSLVLAAKIVLGPRLERSLSILFRGRRRS